MCQSCGYASRSTKGDFCPNCGKRTELKEIYISETTEAKTGPRYEAPTSGAYRGTGRPSGNNPKKETTKNKNHADKILVFTLALILVLAVVSIPAVVIWLSAFDTSDENANSGSGYVAPYDSFDTPTIVSPKLDISKSVSYRNPYPQMEVTSFDYYFDWDFSRGYYTVCNYTIKNTGDADGYVDISLSGSSKGRLYTDTKLLRKGTEIVKSVQIDTNADDAEVYINCTNIEKIGGYYDGYYATVNYSVFNNKSKDVVGTVVIKKASGEEVYREKILVYAGKTYIDSVKIDLKNEKTTISSIEFVNTEYV